MGRMFYVSIPSASGGVEVDGDLRIVGGAPYFRKWKNFETLVADVEARGGVIVDLDTKKRLLPRKGESNGGVHSPSAEESNPA
jgi:hypothetical protein